MLLDPRTPMVVGVVLIFVLVGILTLFSPMPGQLSSSHAQIAGLNQLENCASCHDDSGIAGGCLGCHAEIREQLAEDHGYHAYLIGDDEPACLPCHSEHAGLSFQLVNDVSWGHQAGGAFKHPHLETFLEGAHSSLACDECHTNEEPTTLPGFETFPRLETYLGLSQNCGECHTDVHAGGLVDDCGACHGQDEFHPPVHFDHGEHLPLAGGHDDLDCETCHHIPSLGSVAADEKSAPLPYPFDNPKGTTCNDCHHSPHRADFPEDCSACHEASDPIWVSAVDSMTPERHAAVGFTLDDPHASVACASCHAPELPFDGRHPDPTAPGYLRHQDTCQGCHEDSHGGQFDGRYDRCLDCHEHKRFLPPAFGHEAHAEQYALTGAHSAIPCRACHDDVDTGVRRFVGTPSACRACHESPHAGQFQEEIAANDCSSCHNDIADTFAIDEFDHDGRTGYPLMGAHAEAACDDCHRAAEVTFDGGVRTAQLFRGTPTECGSCHVDIHRGQFRDRESCSDCHQSFTNWKDTVFDHDTQSRFKLEGAHAKVSCVQCHQPVELPDGGQMMQFKPLGRGCNDCHELRPYSRLQNR